MALFRLNFMEISEFTLATYNIKFYDNHFIYYDCISFLKQLLIFVNDFIIQF